MYFQNTLTAISLMGQNASNYSLFYNHTFSRDDESQPLEKLARKFPGLDSEPLSHLDQATQSALCVNSEQYGQYQEKILGGLQSKYLTMIKNVHLHLSYAYLMNGDP